MTKPIRLSVSWGNDVGVNLTISAAQWKKISDGHSVTINGKGYFYEGERFQDVWNFAGGLDGELRVSYGDADGFVGTARDAMAKKKPKTLWYRESPANGDLVFALPENATRVDAIHRALKSDTWGEFRRRLPDDEYVQLAQKMFADAIEPMPVPLDDDPFDGALIPGYYDGDYPDWLQTQMEWILPKRIVKKYGTRIATRLNGSYLQIGADEGEEVAQALKRLGFKVERRDDLMFW
jgi:hypothetical protein